MTLTAEHPASHRQPTRPAPGAAPTRPEVVAAAALLVLLPAGVPQLRFPLWAPTGLLVVALIAVWGAWPVHRAGWSSVRRGAPTSSAFGSVTVLACLGAAVPAAVTSAADPTALVVAAVLPALALIGPDAEAQPHHVRSFERTVTCAVLAMALGGPAVRIATGTDPGTAVEAGLTVLIAGVPFGLVVALAGAEGPAPWRACGRVHTVLLGVPGTVTLGRPSVHTVRPLDDGSDVAKALRLAGAAAGTAADPVIRAVAEAAARHGDLPGVSEFHELPGLGVRALASGLAESPDGPSVWAHAVLVGGPALLTAHGVPAPDGLAAAIDTTTKDEGTSGIVIAWDGLARAVATVGDTVHPDAATTVAALRGLGVRLRLAPHPIAARVATAIGIGPDEVLPDAAAVDEHLRAVRAAGHVVATVDATTADGGVTVEIDGRTAPLEVRDLLGVPGALRAARRARTAAAVTTGTVLAHVTIAVPAAAAGLLAPLPATIGSASACAFAVVGTWWGDRQWSPTPRGHPHSRLLAGRLALRRR